MGHGLDFGAFVAFGWLIRSLDFVAGLSRPLLWKMEAIVHKTTDTVMSLNICFSNGDGDDGVQQGGVPITLHWEQGLRGSRWNRLRSTNGSLRLDSTQNKKKG